mmetsp:Transcript_9648/g.43891  ORF Transcript_9648/g.43891 Transcript_9648/m.43891 type:complete len:294 (+) Transcript_9648:470-1351(+)
MTSHRGAPAAGVARQRGPRSRADPGTDSLPAERMRLRAAAAVAAVARFRVPRAQRLEVLIVEVPVTLRDQRAERGVERVGPGVVIRAKRPRRQSQKRGDVRAAAGSKRAQRRRQILVRSRRQLGPRAAHEQPHVILVRVRVRIRRGCRRVRRVLLRGCVGFIARVSAAARLEHRGESPSLLLRFVGVVTAPRVRRWRGIDVHRELTAGELAQQTHSAAAAAARVTPSRSKLGGDPAAAAAAARVGGIAVPELSQRRVSRWVRRCVVAGRARVGEIQSPLGVHVSVYEMRDRGG